MSLIKDFKEKTKDMSKKEKFSYFWYYYKLAVIAVLIAVIFVVVFVYDMIVQKETAFYSVYFNAGSSLIAEEHTASFAQFCDIDTNTYDVSLDMLSYDPADLSQISMASSQRFVTKYQAAEVDVVVADEKVFESYAGTDIFYNLEEFLPADLIEQHKDSFYYFEKEGETPIPVGIYINDTHVISSVNCYPDADAILGIPANTKHADVAIEYIRFLNNESGSN